MEELDGNFVSARERLIGMEVGFGSRGMKAMLAAFDQYGISASWLKWLRGMFVFRSSWKRFKKR